MFPRNVNQLCLNLDADASVVSEQVVSLHPNEQKLVHAKRIKSHLEIVLQRDIEVVFTDNRSTMISSKTRQGEMFVRLHWMFQSANDQVLAALALYLGKTATPAAASVIDDFISENRGKIGTRKRKRKRTGVQAAGEVYNLAEVLARVQTQYLGGDVQNVYIGWGQKRRKQRRYNKSGMRRVSLATYCFNDNTIRVNPVLDSTKVPSYMIDWIVYHEMLHHILPVEKEGERNLYHSQKFRAMERAFPYYEQAVIWEKDNLSWLIAGE